MRPNFQGAYSPLPPRAFSAPSVSNDRPAYRILKECFLDDRMCFPEELVYWDEEPNKEMEPLNDLAKAASKAFFDHREKLAVMHSATKGVKYIPGARPFDEQRELASADARRVELIKGDGGIPVMGARKRGRPKVEKIDNSGLEEKPIADLTRSHKQAANSVSDS